MNDPECTSIGRSSASALMIVHSCTNRGQILTNLGYQPESSSLQRITLMPTVQDAPIDHADEGEERNTGNRQQKYGGEEL